MLWYVIAFFMIACVLGTMAWYRQLKHRPCKMILWGALTFVFLFGICLSGEAQFLQQRQEHLMQEWENKNTQDAYVYPSPYFEKLAEQEINLLNQYQWDASSARWDSDRNFITSSEVFKNVLLSYIKKASVLEHGNIEYTELQNNPVNHLGNMYEVRAQYISQSGCKNQELLDHFILDQSKYSIMESKLSISGAGTADCIFLEPINKIDSHPLDIEPGTDFVRTGVFIGIADDDSYVFMIN